MMINSILGRFVVVLCVSFAIVGVAPAAEPEPEPELPVIEGEPAVATVNGEPVTLGDLLQELMVRHREVAETDRPGERQDLDAVVERLISIQLVLQEARNIGLNETLDYRQMETSFEVQTLRDMLFERHLEGMTTPDEERVRELYREKVGELRIRSVFIEDDEIAAELESSLGNGGSFEELVRKLVEEGKAQGGDESPWVPASDLLPQIRKAAWDLEAGEISALIPINGSFGIFRLIDKRVHENPEVLAEVENQAIGEKRMDAARQYAESLKERYAEVDEALLEKVDYEADGVDFADFLTDSRPLATIEGGKPITVAQLSEKLRANFFHGVDQAAERGRINDRKMAVLQDLLDRQVVVAEARRLELDRTRQFDEKHREFEKRMLFATFVQRVIAPDVDPTEETLREYYDEHLDEFSVPERIRIEALAFGDRADAEQALSKLVSGADLGWMRANARGQADLSEDEEPMPFDGRPLEVTTLPESLHKSVSGSSSGDYRFHAGDDGRFYVLYIRQLIPSKAQPFEAVRGGILKGATARDEWEALQAWVAELRKVSEIQVFLTGDALRDAVGMDSKASE